MYTTFDKTLVTLIMGVIGVIGVLWRPFDISAEVVASLVSTLTPLIVYIWPNAPNAPKDPPTA